MPSAASFGMYPWFLNESAPQLCLQSGCQFSGCQFSGGIAISTKRISRRRYPWIFCTESWRVECRVRVEQLACSEDKGWGVSPSSQIQNKRCGEGMFPSVVTTQVCGDFLHEVVKFLHCCRRFVHAPVRCVFTCIRTAWCVWSHSACAARPCM